MTVAFTLPDDWAITQKSLSPRLRKWFSQAQRDLPWRHTRDPWAIWVSEIMLQQTQVLTVQGYYERFMKRFPTLQSLADSDLQAVLNLWAGLGYYRRAKHLHAAAQAVVQHHHGRIPPTAANLMTLPGIGRYTAGAIASIAYGEKVALLDGNVMRVLARIGAITANIALPQTQQQLWVMAESLVPEPATKTSLNLNPPGDHNQALMELGALICLPPPQTPQCLLCPLKNLCRANQQGIQDQLPVKTAKKTTPTIAQTALLIRDKHGSLLLLQRPSGGLWEHLWEFPVLPQISPQLRLNSPHQLTDVIHRTLGLRLELEPDVVEVRHQLTHRLMCYRIYRARSAQVAPAVHLPVCNDGQAAKNRPPHAYQAWRWISPADLFQGAAARESPDRVPLATVVHKIAHAAGINTPPAPEPRAARRKNKTG